MQNYGIRRAMRWLACMKIVTTSWAATWQSLGWNTTDDQQLRFRVLSQIANLSGVSVCDIGCGFADLLPFLRERFDDVTYTGVDVTPSFLPRPKTAFPESSFHCLDILKLHSPSGQP